MFFLSFEMKGYECKIQNKFRLQKKSIKKECVEHHWQIKGREKLGGTPRPRPPLKMLGGLILKNDYGAPF